MVDGMTGLATGNRSLKMLKREQTIYTPQSVIDVVLKVWPEGIALDPCSGPESIVPADVHLDVEDDGLLQGWADRTYVNPPYDELGAWLNVSTACGKSGLEVLMLCPVRTNRRWFRAAWKSCDARGGLDPVKFVGFKSGFPAPLCLLYWGQRSEVFDEAVLAIGEPL